MFQGTSSESHSGKKSANEVIRLIDLQISDLRESIRVLHSQRNDHLPISKLPVEILTKIFLLHQKNLTRIYPATFDWIGITHVSQRWREIALNFSGLWIRIPFDHPKWAKEMIARSQQACLIVRATYDSSKTGSPQAKLLRSFLQQHLSRVQVLDIWRTTPQLVIKLFQDIQPTSVPSLSTLSLSMWEEPGTESSAVLESLQIVDSRLLNTNSLRKVEASTALGWDFRLFSGLTHLSLGDGDRNMARTQTSQRDFLDALHRMPTLQCLKLTGPVLPEAVDGSLLDPVYLPDLRDLSIFDTVSTIEFFLHYVTFPPTTRTIIGCKHIGAVMQVAHISPVLVPLKRLLSARPHTLKLHGIKFSCSEDPEDWDMVDLRFKGWVSSDPPPSLEGYNPNFLFDNPDFTFFVRWNLPTNDLPPDIDEFIAGVFGAFPQDDVVSLSLSSYKITDTWFTPFSRKIGRLPALNALYLDHISSTQILLDLDCDAPQEGVNLPTTTYPALLYLDFNKCGIKTPAVKTLYNCLKKRSERGLGPRKLRVDLRGVKQSDKIKKATALLEKVVEVVWEVDSDFEDSDTDTDSYLLY